MDSVPYKFCEEVIGLLNMKKDDCAEIAKQLTGLWKSAAERYAENLRRFEMKIWKNTEDNWFCRLDRTRDMNDDIKLPDSIAELLAIDRRFVRIANVTIDRDGSRYPGGSIIAMSKDDLIKKLIPFLNALTVHPAQCSYDPSDYHEHRCAYLDIFQRYVAFRTLYLIHHGPESEDYLAAQVKNNLFLSYIEIKGWLDWPNSDRVEDLVVEFMRRPKVKVRIQGNLMVTTKTIEAVFKLWHESGKSIDLGWARGPTEEELLSLPLPKGVKRTEERENGLLLTTFIVRWTKKNTPDLTYKFQEDHHYRFATIECRANEIDEHLNHRFMQCTCL
ncbi:hypothetical protein QR680_010700 [Steinernema hermaphroditum]|uniref:Uncharacterized protein n=1 Tax=Steinernema hermaphroditum TaxID=289476 RepID=A0AA39IRN4_9BILA|nr:hypothetical protein QR680_010700 [Steinernema hermaphroditum]